MSPLAVRGWEKLDSGLQSEIKSLRQHYATALAAAARGQFGGRELAALGVRVGRLMAEQARRSPQQRGCTLAELSLALDAMFPELRGWQDRRVEQIQRSRLQPAVAKAPVGRTA